MADQKWRKGKNIKRHDKKSKTKKTPKTFNKQNTK